MKVPPSTAIIALTNNGGRLGARVRSLLPNCDLLLPTRRGVDIADAQRFDDGISAAVARAFVHYDRLLLIFSTGIAVRALAGCLRDKRQDPAVVVMDEKGQFAISLLSGHLGGANRFALDLAHLLDAVSVITTASDVADTISVDLLGEEYGWEIEDGANLTQISAAVVNGEPVLVYQDAGEAWWPSDKPLPYNISVAVDLSRLDQRFAALVITDRLLDVPIEMLANAIVYRPKSLVVGIGCNRGTSADEIETAVRQVLAEGRLSWRSIRCFASIDAKRSEGGLVEFANGSSLPLEFFTAAELDRVQGIANPSDVARRWVGSRSVSEAAALLAAGSSQLTVPKNKLGNCTVAVARVPSSHWLTATNCPSGQGAVSL